MNTLLILLLSLFVLGTLGQSSENEDVNKNSFDEEVQSFLGRTMPPADCPGQVCPKGFYCRKGVCTLWQPVRKFSAVRKDCRKDSDCPGTDLCSSRECKPVSYFQRCNEMSEMSECPEENSCEFGLCRYMLDIEVFDDQNPKHVVLNNSIASGM